MSDVIMPKVGDSHEEIFERIKQALNDNDKISVVRILAEEQPGDVAEVLDMLDFDTLVDILRQLLLTNIDHLAEILIELDQSTIARLYTRFTEREWAIVFKELSDDDIVYLLDLFPPGAQDALLPRIAKADQAEIRKIMNYPEETAGRLMTTEFLALDESDTVAHAIESIRTTRDIDPMNCLYLYVTSGGKLTGMVTMRQLLLAKDKNVMLRAIMHTDVSPVLVHMDQEEVAEIVTRHDEVSVPVVDDEGHILGIVTVDDVIDVINEESEEDIYLAMGSSEEEALHRDKTLKVVSLRLPWIMASFFGSLLVVMVMRFTEEDFFGEKAAKIFIFVPMICAMGGNVGVQSATIMARLLSQSHLDWAEARRSAFTESKVGLTMGLICGTLIGTISYFWGGIGMVVTVMSAMTATLTTAAVTGTLIPVAMKRAGFDPALATGPFVTSMNDFLAVCVYFSIAWIFRDHLGV